MKRGAVPALVAACVSWALGASAQTAATYNDVESSQWQEAPTELPRFPQAADLREFHVSATTPHRFFVDGATLSVGQDGVVRYALVVQSAGGATNVSYEGIRCATREYKIYATGRDGQWMPVRMSQWRPIENKPVNRYHAALAREYFCPLGTPITSAEEGRMALRSGRHPQLP